MITEETIQAMAKRIVENFHPQKIILFGSHATGKDTEDSDVDLIVVMPVEGPRWKKAVEIREVISDIRGAKDIFVITPRDYEARKDIPGSLPYPAEHGGKVLYAA